MIRVVLSTAVTMQKAGGSTRLSESSDSIAQVPIVKQFNLDRRPFFSAHGLSLTILVG
jgi:hypothetical protein